MEDKVEVLEEDICQEYLDDPYMVEDWAWCVGASINDTIFKERNWTAIRAASANFSCTAYFHHYISYEPVLYQYVIPIICLLGIIGNVLNIFVLTRGKMLRVLDTMERSAIYGLIALALSDMMFCVGVLPNAVVTMETAATTYTYASRAYALYYRLYSLGAINCFVMISSWLIVFIAVNRLVVVVWPIQARYMITQARAVAGIVAVFFLGVVFTAPFFAVRSIRSCVSLDGTAMVEALLTYRAATTQRLMTYCVHVWPVLAHFVPFAVLFICNVGIIVTLKKAATGRRESSAHNVRGNSHNRVTFTLVAIVLMYFVLVFPGEVFKAVDPTTMDDTKLILQEVFNLLHTINFTCNFVLYCLVNRSFRSTSKALLSSSCCKRPKRHLTSSTRLTELQTRSISKWVRLVFTGKTCKSPVSVSDREKSERAFSKDGANRRRSGDRSPVANGSSNSLFEKKAVHGANGRRECSSLPNEPVKVGSTKGTAKCGLFDSRVDCKLFDEKSGDNRLETTKNFTVHKDAYDDRHSKKGDTYRPVAPCPGTNCDPSRSIQHSISSRPMGKSESHIGTSRSNENEREPMQRDQEIDQSERMGQTFSEGQHKKLRLKCATCV